MNGFLRRWKAPAMIFPDEEQYLNAVREGEGAFVLYLEELIEEGKWQIEEKTPHWM